MPSQVTRQPKGGHNLSTSETRKRKYAGYAAAHGMRKHKFEQSKEHRGCGPLGRYIRWKKAHNEL